MNQYHPEPLQLGEHTLPIPLLQGGMGVLVSASRLAAAVTLAGGCGVIATAGIGANEPGGMMDFVKTNNQALVKHIQLLRRRYAEVMGNTDTPIFGVNIMGVLRNCQDLVRTAVAQEVPFIFASAGSHRSLPALLDQTNRKTEVIPIVSSAYAANFFASVWKKRFNYLPPAVVVEGPLAGGHLGFTREQITDPRYSLKKLVPEVKKALADYNNGQGIPVIAAGGLYDGYDMHEFIHDYGAAGIQMATRFVTTVECDAHEAFKQSYLRATGPADLRIIDSPVGYLGRAIGNAFLDAVAAGQKQPTSCPYHCITTCHPKEAPYCIAKALTSAQNGDLDHGFAFAGANAWRATHLTTVEKVVAELLRDYAERAEISQWKKQHGFI